MHREELRPVDLSQVTTVPLRSRPNKVSLKDFTAPGTKGLSFRQFLQTFPGQLAAQDFGAVVQAMVAAHRRDRPIIWGVGAHVIKCGLSLFIIELLQRRIITAVALNGAGVIHDVEIALVGGTSEDVAEGLGEGSFGMAEETGRFINEALARATSEPRGMGELIGAALLEARAPHLSHSILGQAAILGVPVTVHVAVGTDITHMHPSARGEAIGAASFYDFRLLCRLVCDLEGGGMYVNVGSAVLLPEVFLKALTVARNLGHTVRDLVTVNLDMQQHYRPVQNVVRRPTAQGGRGYALTGHHEIMIPLLVQAVLEELEDEPHPSSGAHPPPHHSG